MTTDSNTITIYRVCDHRQAYFCTRIQTTFSVALMCIFFVDEPHGTPIIDTSRPHGCIFRQIYNNNSPKLGAYWIAFRDHTNSQPDIHLTPTPLDCDFGAPDQNMP